MAQLLRAKRKEIKVARAQGGAFGALSPLSAFSAASDTSWSAVIRVSCI
jgi:hypothetical protein